jgi:hypothetical protein
MRIGHDNNPGGNNLTGPLTTPAEECGKLKGCQLLSDSDACRHADNNVEDATLLSCCHTPIGVTP